MRSRFRDIRLQNKFILIFIIVIMVPIVLLGFVLFSQYQATLRQQSYEFSHNTLAEIYDHVDRIITEDTAAFEDVFYSKEFIDKILEAENSEQQKAPVFIESGDVVTMLADMLEMTPGFSSAYVYLSSGRRYLYHKNDEKCDPLYNLDEEPWIKLIEESQSEVSFMGLHMDMQTMSKTNKVFSVVLKMDLTQKPDVSYPDSDVAEYDELYFTTPVYMVCNMDYEYYIDTFLRDVNADEITCINPDSTIIFSSNENLIGQHIDAHIGDVDISQQEGNAISELEDGKYLISWKRSDFTGITTLIVEENDELVKELYDMQTLTILSILVMSVVFIILIILVIRSMTKPVEKLVKAMTKDNGQRKGVPVIVDRRDEIGVLGAQYNTLLHDIDQLLLEIKSGYERERKLENEVLEAQINPHFIYNTLNSIRNIALMQNSQTVALAIKELIQLLQSSIKIGEPFISIDEEIAQLKNYEALQKIRYLDSFHISYDIEQEVRKYSTIKFLLQSIVENAIYHGIEAKQRYGEISVRIFKREEKIVYIIADNGIGMSKTKLEELNGILASSVKTRGYNKVGLKNVNERIKLYFGEQYGITLKSLEGNGTEVTVIIPAVKYVDRDEGTKS